MRVKATRMGYYNHVRRNEDEVFEMSEKVMKVGADKKPILPSWVVRAEGLRETTPKGTVKADGLKTVVPGEPVAAASADESEVI